MLLKKTNFFDDFEDSVKPQNWSFKNPNVSAEEFKPQKRERKEVVLQESDVSFGELGLCKPLVKACSDLGFLSATFVQEQTIPIVLKGSDAIICAKTGSGKTGAFLLPILHKLLHRTRITQSTRCIILSPTRELCQQTFSMLESYTKYTDLRARVVFGGANSAKEQKQLQDAPDIIVGTPGRVLDHILNTKDFTTEHVEYLILDEADRLLDMGFTAELKEIIKELPVERQTILASATIGENVKDLVKLALKTPVRIGKEGVPDTLHQVIVRIKDDWPRDAIVYYLIKYQVKQGVIVFTKTINDCHRVFLLLQLNGIKVTELHGRLQQSLRLKALRDFQEGDVDVLVATDLASRGLDLPVEAVINMNVPEELSKLMHRIGRTARAGQEGISISICNEAERTLIRKTIKKSSSSLALDKEKLELCIETCKGYNQKIRDIIQDEKYERELKKAEMEATKAENTMKFEKEIYNKPKKEWIHKDYEKKDTKTSVKEQKVSKELQSKIMRHKFMLEGYKNAAKGIKMIEKHVAKARKPKKKSNKK